MSVKLVIIKVVISVVVFFTIQIGTSQTPNTHLNFESTDKGILIPRLDSSVRNAIIPNLNEESLLVYDNDLKQFMFWDGNEWSQIGNKERYVYPQELNILMGRGVGFNRIINEVNGDGRFNTVIGNFAGTAFTTARSNVILGHAAGKDLEHGSGNVLLGNNAGVNIDTSENLVAIGNLVGGRNSGTSNTFVGAFSGRDNTTGRSNTFFGFGAGQLNEGGNSNTLIGANSGPKIVTNFRNTMLGAAAGFNSIGNFNTFIGNSAGAGFINGFRNIALGMDSGRSLDGNRNIVIGTGAAYESDSLYQVSNSIYIGNEIGKNAPSSNELIIETSDDNNPLIKGDFLNNTLTIGGSLTATSLSSQLLRTDLTLKVNPTNIALTCNSEDSEGVIYYRNHKLQICTVTDDTDPMNLVYGWVELHL